MKIEEIEKILLNAKKEFLPQVIVNKVVISFMDYEIEDRCYISLYDNNGILVAYVDKDKIETIE